MGQKKIKPEKPNPKAISKRFTIISIIIFLLFGLSYLFIKQYDNFIIFNFVLGYGVAFWFLFDYKILQLNRFYLMSMLIGLLIGLYGYYIYRNITSSSDKMVLFSAILPFYFLVNQRIFRYIFKSLMKREPIVDKSSPSFADGIYAFTLAMVTFVTPGFIIEYCAL